MEFTRRVDDQIVSTPDGDRPAVTVREMVLDHDRRLDRLERWQIRTEVYERLLKWTLAVAATAAIVGIINLLINLALAGMIR